MTDTEKDSLKQQNMIRFVEAAQELIETEGIKKLSIRKIAEKAGFHNSTIYLYFKDINQLIMLASMKYFAEYSRTLAKFSQKNLTPAENFSAVWDIFGKTAFEKPEIFYNFFFGKHSKYLTPVIQKYYELFPEEKDSYSSDVIEQMYYGKNIEERCLKLLEPFIDMEGNSVTKENYQTINKITVCCLHYLLKQKCDIPELDAEALNNELLNMVTHITGI